MQVESLGLQLNEVGDLIVFLLESSLTLLHLLELSFSLFLVLVYVCALCVWLGSQVVILSQALSGSL